MNKKIFLGVILIFLEAALLLSLFSLLPEEVIAGVGSPSTEQTSKLEVGNSFPEVHNVSINYGSAISLNPNSTKQVDCLGIIVDYNGDGDINSSNSSIFDNSISYSDTDDNNNHYTNSSCHINTSFVSFGGIADDSYNALVNCTFYLEYYANPTTWNCTIRAIDQQGASGYGSETQSVSELLALGVPDIIQYGTVDAISVSDEQVINVTNYGNTKANISLEGYAQSQNDGNAMNCTLGSIGTISIENEKYNLTGSNQSSLNLIEFNSIYTNLTTTPIVKEFNLTSRVDDLVEDTIKPTYWRIYIPTGVAGTCQGNIIFGATTAQEVQ